MQDYQKNIENTTFSEPLTAEDLRALSQCFITPEIAKAAGIARVSDEQGAAIICRKRNASANYSGWIVPYKSVKTGQTLEYELRRDVPDRETKNGREREVSKYLRPVGSKSLAYFPPMTNPEHLTDTLVTVIFSEGVKKILAMENALTDNLKKPLPFLLVGLSGVDNFKTTQTEIKTSGEKRQVKDVLPELKEIDFEGREVLIIYDSNVFSNKNVYFARHRFAETLLSLGAVVYYVNLPQIENVNGIDDLLGFWEREEGREKAIEKFNELLKTKRKFIAGAVFSRPLAGGALTLKIESGERNKAKISVLDAVGKTVDLHVFNPSDADKRAAFIKKQIEPAFDLTDADKKEITKELIRLAGLAEIVTKADKSVSPALGETVETSFKVLQDGRIIEQIKGGFALYDPETGEAELVQSVTDADGTTYSLVDDELFQKSGGIQLADALEEYGTESELIAEIANYLSTYLDLKPLQLKLTALYILFTYIFDSVLELSYLNATGDAGSGKSRFGLTVCLASRRGLSLITPSAASLYRIVDKHKPTLFLDEFNTDANSDDAAAIIQILNAGFQKTAQIPRQVATADGKFKTEMFDGFCPKIIGSLKQSASNAFNSRCIEIQMERTTRNDIPLRLSHNLLKDAQSLRNKLTLWRLRNIGRDFEAELDRAERELRQHEIMPRSIQINIPLFALINDDELKKDFIKLLKGRDEVLNEEKQRTIDGEIVQMIYNILFDIVEDDKDKSRAEWKIPRPEEDCLCEDLRIEKIVSMLNENGRKEKDHLNEKYVGKKISSLGLRSKQILTRKSAYHKKSAILFDSRRFEVIFRNYGLPVPRDFSLDQLDQNNNSNVHNSLSWSDENCSDIAPQNSLDQSKPNSCNNNEKWSNWSKENSENGGQNGKSDYSDHAEIKKMVVDEVM